ncbi:hypothetical protein T01_10449 [Trichinella spiralis]|uniref:Uncharacterized protein n=1 Tax=Trichinella spiralis TaxID=6334 RepID=A0A0V1BPX2_TRISP|nr:hypothetical protein T01_10449 [Trichinella spiralis]
MKTIVVDKQHPTPPQQPPTKKSDIQLIDKTTIDQRGVNNNAEAARKEQTADEKPQLLITNQPPTASPRAKQTLWLASKSSSTSAFARR